VEAVDPLLAVTGIGENNRFGFPHSSVSARYLGRGTPLLWTARHGTIRLCTDGFTLSAEQLRERGRPDLFRAWSVFDIAEWRDRAAIAPPPLRRRGTGHSRRINSVRPPERTPKTSPKRQRPQRRTTRRKENDTHKQGTVTASDEKEWQRSRKRRKRLRAPWK
jgi:hypothetical protein